MAVQLHQAGSAPAEPIDRAAERVLAETLLHQHRQAHHPFAHVGVTARQVDAHARRQSDHRGNSAASTRRSAFSSTAASTRNVTPAGNTISIRPRG